jgi:nicotinate-nucleotide pyrophosphorylase (carboxylating)
MDAQADRVLLDEFDDAGLHAAVAMAAGRVPLEVSGGVRLDDLPRIAASGVDFVSIGSLTKHVEAVDLSLRILPPP